MIVLCGISQFDRARAKLREAQKFHDVVESPHRYREAETVWLDGAAE
jgi:hypothetical protein